MILWESPQPLSIVRVIDAAAKSGDEGETGVAGQQDFSPIRIETFIKVDPETLAHHAFTKVPREILRNIAGTDLIMASIQKRVAQWWPELVV